MKTILALDENDIVQIIADHFRVDEEAVSLEIHPTVKGSGATQYTDYEVSCVVQISHKSDFDAWKRLHRDGQRLTTVLLASTGSGETTTDTTPDAQGSEDTSVATEKTAESRPTRRVERLLGPKAYWLPHHEGPIRTERGNKVKGFVHIKCDKCGESSTNYLRDYQDSYRCPGCGKRHPLDFRELRSAFTKCSSCGNELRYLTNETAEQLEIACKDCGAPMDLALNASGTDYVMVK